MPILIALFGRLGLSAGLSRVLGFMVPAALVVALLGALWLWLDHREKADDKANQEIGAAVQREGDLQETITRVKEANDAREDNRTRTDEQRHTDCLRRSRTPENC